MYHEIAPDFFKIDDADGTAFVTKQPTTEEEIAKCEEAMKAVQ